MRIRQAGALFALVLILAASAAGQEPAAKPMGAREPEVGMKARPAEEPLDIWQIDLNPSGTGFALTTPVDQGDVYVFKVWPDRATVHLKKSRVKKMVRRTKDINSEVIYQIDLVPTGQVYSREVPHQRGNSIEYKAWHQGTLMALRQADVKRVTKVAGLEAFKIHLQLLGAKAIGNLPMEGGGNVTMINEQPAPAQQPADPSMAPSNWIFNGVPGVTDAWAPPSAVVASPGDVPRARDPRSR
jgi:hypothetical protein